MRARLTHVAVITLTSTLLACGGHTPTGPSSTPAPTTFTLNGQVIDSATRLGIAAASVSIVDGPDAGKWAMTDASGSYRLGDLQEATLTVKAHAPHYVSQTKSVTLTGNQTLSFALVATGSPPHPSMRTRTKTSLRGSNHGLPQHYVLSGATMRNGKYSDGRCPKTGPTSNVLKRCPSA